MRKFKALISLLLSFLMILSLVSSPSALVVKDYDTITGVKGDRAIVMGKAPEHKDQFVSVMLLAGDGTNATADDILYVDTVKADSQGYYEVKIKYPNFNISNGIVDNCVLRIKAGFEDITDSVLSAEVKQTDVIAVELDTTVNEKNVTAIAQLNNLYGLDANALVMLAAYDSSNKLLGVAMADKVISGETDSISVTYENVPTYERLVAYIWESGASLVPYAEPKAVVIENRVRDLVIHPGGDETMRRFTWYNTQETSGAQLQYALKKDYIEDGGFTDSNSVIVEGRTEAPYMNTVDLSCKAEIEGLELGTEYVYRVGNALTFDDNVYSFKTYDVDNSDKQVFAIVSDLHNSMLNNSSLTDSNAALKINIFSNAYKSMLLQYPDTQFVVSAGDNVTVGGNGYTVDDTNKEQYRIIQELEMDQLFAPENYRSLPFITVMGNHEVLKYGELYGSVNRYHYNFPNEDGTSGTYVNTNSCGNWWFRNGDVLIIGINAYSASTSGVYQYITPSVHKAYIDKVFAENTDAKWKVLVNHAPAYSAIIHTGQIGSLRNLYANLDLDSYNFDVIFSGHQHTFTRTHQLLTNKYADTEYFTYPDKDGKTQSIMQPKIVSRDKVVSTTTEGGYKFDTVTDPEGTVHIDVPPLSLLGHDDATPDFKNFSVSYGVKSTAALVYPDGSSATADFSEAFEYTTGCYMMVTVEKNANGSQQMKCELVQSNASSSKPSETGKVLDTYIITKTK